MFDSAFLERFWARVDRSGGPSSCWPWTGGAHSKKRTPSYGSVRWNGKPWLTHKIALMIELGRFLEEGMQSLHSCDNPPCCNPAHLYEGSQADNIADIYIRNRRDTETARKRMSEAARRRWDRAKQTSL